MAEDSPFPGEVPLDLPVPGGDPAIAIDTFGTPQPVHAREIEEELDLEHGVRANVTAKGRTIFVRTPGEEDITDLLMDEPNLITLVERVGERVDRETPVRKAYLTKYQSGPL